MAISTALYGFEKWKLCKEGRKMGMEDGSVSQKMLGKVADDFMEAEENK